ncbi:MAG: PaaI family thioesterase [Rhodocyclaceae bacterium]|nr:PaaI family thioesterase [Rhodocyclaceae bacterium]
MNFKPRDAHFAERVKASYAKQSALALIGAQLMRVEPGRVDIHLPFRADLQQQHGFIHGGVVVMIADSASGYAAMTLVDAASSVLSVQHSTNFLAPAQGEWLEAHGHVVKSGRTLIIAEAEVYAIREGHRHLCAKLNQTVMVMQGKPEKEERGES